MIESPLTYAYTRKWLLDVLRHLRPMAIVTPMIGVQRALCPLTFGSFLPHTFQPIFEDTELEINMAMRPDPARKRISRRTEDSQFPHHLQVFKSSASSQASPAAKLVVMETMVKE